MSAWMWWALAAWCVLSVPSALVLCRVLRARNGQRPTAGVSR